MSTVTAGAAPAVDPVADVAADGAGAPDDGAAEAEAGAAEAEAGAAEDEPAGAADAVGLAEEVDAAEVPEALVAPVATAEAPSGSTRPKAKMNRRRIETFPFRAVGAAINACQASEPAAISS